jgi:glycosyltransferase involved in cell wall biosynthesis
MEPSDVQLLIVTGIFPPDRGGPASSVPRVAGALTARGHRVKVICLSDRLDHDDSIYPFNVQRIRRGLFWPWRVAVTTFQVWRAALRSDLVYVNGLGAESALAALLAGRRTVHKIVGDYAWERAVGRGWFRGTLDEYQSAPKGFALQALDFIRTFPLRLAAQLIVPSRYLRRIVEGWGLAPEKVRVIYNATTAAAPRDDPGATALPPWWGRTLITVCRLMPWKRVDGLLRVLPELPDTRLIVAGDGHLRRELEAMARSLDVADRVVFLGDVPHPVVRSYLAQADAFVLNSSYEGLPHVVLEAMAAGVPVIATDAGGTAEVVEDQITGLLLPIDDPTALKTAVERLWADPALGRRLVAEATRQLAGLFDFESMVNQTEATLLGAMESASGPQPVHVEEPR